MAVVLRLMRAGAKKRPFYRIVAADSRRQRDGRFLEILGHYDPIANPFTLKVDQDKAARWISHGAQPSEQVASLLKRSGMVLNAPKVAAAKTAKPAPKPAARKAAARKAAGSKAGTAKAAPKRAASARKTEKKAAKKAAKKSGAPAAKAKKSAKK